MATRGESFFAPRRLLSHGPEAFAGLLLLLVIATACSPASRPIPGAGTAMPTRAVRPQMAAALHSRSEAYPWWSDVTFYEIFVRSFADSNGDGIGDLKGLIGRLDYLNDGDPATTDDLGVTGLWLMPIQPAVSYHGYDPTDYLSVNPDYGTLADMKRLVTECHARGMRVILDLVLNHTSNVHPWFTASLDPASTFRTWYVWSDHDPGVPNWHVASSGYYYGFFGENMPDLNLENSEVTQTLEETAGFWLREVGVDGFRLDAVKYLVEEGQVTQNSESTHAWLRSYADYLRATDAEALALGEVWDTTGVVSTYMSDTHMDLAFEFSLAQSILASVRVGRADEVRRTLNTVLLAYAPGRFATFLSNHDQNRVMSQLAQSGGKARVAASMLLTLPGVPFIYYGEEIGMQGVKPDEQIRTPMQWSNLPGAGFTSGTPWEAIHQDYPSVNVTAQRRDARSLFAHYRRLISLRARLSALRVGETYLVGSHEPAVFSLLRVSRDEQVLVIINLSDREITDFDLRLGQSPLRGSYATEALLGATPGRKVTATPSGGFEIGNPANGLAPFSTHIVLLRPTG